MRMVKSYYQFRRKAKTRHGVHSPFVYELIEQVLRGKDWARKNDITALYKDLRKNRDVITVNDLGAGSRKRLGEKRKVSSVARISSGRPKFVGMIQRLATYLMAGNVLELGSNLGVCTAALAASPACKKCISIEGSDQLAALAVKNLERVGLKADVWTGSFENKLPLALKLLKKVDLAYIDGNHQKLPTISYFDNIVKFIDSNSVIVIGDIHWSAEMEEAWEIIKVRENVIMTIDTFEVGMVFFRKELSREHYTIHY